MFEKLFPEMVKSETIKKGKLFCKGFIGCENSGQDEEKFEFKKVLKGGN